jgi:hypothetical protein
VAEKRGDALRAAGDKAGAARAYREALQHRPLMDYDYARVHAKYRSMALHEWSGKLDDAMNASSDPTARLLALLALRVEARTSGAPAKNIDEIDQAVARASDATSLAAAEPDRAAAHLEELLAAFATARARSAPKATLDALTAATVEHVHAAVPMPPSQTGLERLQWALALRSQVREQGLPVDIDASLDALFAPLATAAVPSVPAERAADEMTSAIALKQRALQLGAPAAAIEFVDRMLDATLGPALARAQAVARQHDYVTAYAELGAALAPLATTHPRRAQLGAIATDAVAYYTGEAAKHPPGLVHLTYASLAAYFGGPSVAAESTALASTWSVPVRLEPTFDGSPCGALTSQIAATGAGRAARVSVHLDTCTIDDAVTSESRTKPYETEEQRQSGSHKVVTKEKVPDNGTHFEDCTSREGIAGVVLARCEVQNTGYITIEHVTDVPDFETVKVPGRQPYSAEIHRLRAQISGTAVTTWDDGTVLRVPIRVDTTATDERWSVTYPGATAGAPARTEGHDLAPSFNVASMTASAASNVSSQIDGIRQAIAAHRAEVARAEGVAALGRGDDAAAGEAFVRSVLISGRATDEAAAWLSRTTGVSPESIASALRGGRAPEPRAPDWPMAMAYGGGAIPETAEPERVVSVVDSSALDTDDELKDYLLKYGYDHGYAFLAALPYQLETTAGTRTSPMLGVMLGSSPIGRKTNYGLVVRDDLGIKAGLGYRLGDGLGPDEGHLVWGVDAGYWFMLGLRTHTFGIYAGAGGGFMKLSAGDSKASGFHVEPIAEIQVRAIGAYNITLDVTGFATLASSLARTDRVSMLLPFTPRTGLGIMAVYESTNLETTSTMTDGSAVDLGRQTARLFVLGVGGNY